MDDSPRSSKRRKLDTPSRNASSPLVRSTLRKSSARVAGRHTLTTNDEAVEIVEAEDVPTPSRRSSRKTANDTNGTVNGTTHKEALAEEVDVYDDIEGALPAYGESPRVPARTRSPLPTTRVTRTTPKATPKATPKKSGRYKKEFDPTLPHPFKSNPGTPAKPSATNDTVNPESASRFRSLVNGYKYSDGADGPDELARDIPTPTRRTRNTPRGGAADVSPVKGKGTASAKKPIGRTPRAAATQEDDGDALVLQSIGVNGASPSQGRSARKPAGSARGRKQAATEDILETTVTTPSRLSRRKDPVPDSEDELGDYAPPSRTRSAKDRRQANRADHINNREETEEEDNAAVEINEEDEDDMSVDGNSVVESILDPTEPSPFNKPSSATKKPDATTLLQVTLAPGRELDLLKSIAMERIMSKRPVPVVGLDEEYKTVHQLVEHTITAGEGNSMLLIGARGSGKTALVNKVLSEISRDNAEDYHVVRLNGFIHTDDKIALREIWRQLGKEMDIEEDGGLGKNYADTLTTLLALLSHPSEQTGELTDQVAKAVIFVMDEFDLFALHPRQTLLYNLFEIAQSRKAPIAVLGLTTRIDVANSLEKRVKSRFSHRYVHLSLAKTFTAFQELCKATLIIKPDQLSIEERAILCKAPSTTPSKNKKTQKSAKHDNLTTWNENINFLFSSPTFLTMHLAPHYYLTKSVPVALTSFLIPIVTLSPSSTIAPNTSTSLAAPDSKLTLLTFLSTLALSLLIAAARLDIIHDSDTCNFNMAYDEYVTLASKARIQSAVGGLSASGAVSKVWGKEVARREWEGLVELGLIVPVVAGQIGSFGMCRCDVSLEEVGVVVGREKGIEKALERWCRQL